MQEDKPNQIASGHEDFISDKKLEEFLKQRNTPVKLTTPTGAWTSARHARELVSHYTKVPLSVAERTICRRAAKWVALKVHTFGRIERAHDYVPYESILRRRDDPKLTHFRLNPLPDDWEEVRSFFECLESGQQFDGEVGVYYADWASGDFKIAFDRDFSIVTIELTGLTFDENALLESIGVSASAELHRIEEGEELVVTSEPLHSPTIAPNFGGRPRYGWWEEAVTAIAAMLYNGDLKPSRQKDIEEALADWIQNNGHGASESSIAARARKIFRAINRDDVELQKPSN